CSNAQPDQYNIEEWQAEASTNKRLLPRYGHLPKTESERTADSEFIARIKAQEDFKTMRDESNHLVLLDFEYLDRGDIKTAMYRFSQAYRLDSTSTDDYWGYGAVYLRLGSPDLAIEQYKTASL